MCNIVALLGGRSRGHGPSRLGELLLRQLLCGGHVSVYSSLWSRGSRWRWRWESRGGAAGGGLVSGGIWTDAKKMRRRPWMRSEFKTVRRRGRNCGSASCAVPLPLACERHSSPCIPSPHLGRGYEIPPTYVPRYLSRKRPPRMHGTGTPRSLVEIFSSSVSCALPIW